MKALRLDKAQRYPTFAALSANVEAFQSGFATSAEQAGALKQIQLLVRHHKVVSTALAAILLLSIGFVFSLIASERKADRNAKDAIGSKGVTKRERDDARSALARSEISLSAAAFRENDSQAMMAALNRVPVDLRDGDWRYFHRRADTSEATFFPTAGSFIGSAANPKRPGVFASSPTITGHILDNLSGVATATAKIDKLDPVALTFDATGKFTLPAGTFAQGPHTLVINATDAVGNAANPFTVHFTVDTLDPTITLTTPRNDGILAVETRLTGRADGTGSPIVSLCYRFDGGPLIPILYNTATGAFDDLPDLGALAPGAHVLTLDTLDAAGHHLVKTLNVTLDARIPFTVTEHTPASFASEVGSTFRPQVDRKSVV